LSPMGNGGVAVSFRFGANGNTLGGTTAAARNLLCASTNQGIFMNFASNEIVQGNYIGVGADGATPLGNGRAVPTNTQAGIYVLVGESNMIGGAVAGAGNVISANGNDGVQFFGLGTSYNTVQGNYIGTTANGSTAIGNGASGVSFLYGPQSNTLGGATAAARNVIAASTYDGIYIAGASNNIIQGNYIGTDSTGLNSFGNGYEGIYMQSASAGNQIGGASAGQGNVIASSGYHGIFLTDAGTTGNLIQGNNIGVGSDGVTPMGNGLQGIILQLGATANTIGLALNGSGAGNIIANNTYEGIIVYDAATVGNTFRGNSIHDNGSLGINLVGGAETYPYYVTPNHVGGAVPGPEDLQNFPVITNASVALGSTTVSGTLNSTASRGFLVDVYRNASPDPSGYGEGQVYVGTANLTTDGGGNGSFSLTPGGSFAGQYFTVTATDATTGDTSEFGADVTATNGAIPLAFLGPYSWSRTNGFSLSMALVTNQQYTVQMATNLSTNPTVWINLTNFTATNTTTQFTDHSATNLAIHARFYRIVSP
jgi:hypothetical protein